ncbi:MAG: class I SAM-dependent RNA methyltransferase [Betaproteobacteria bacterium]|nr:class I SAM-dependent RNA methyltransferase [Betaproteobacteria bacterium]
MNVARARRPHTPRSSPADRFFAPCPRGLEEALRAELQEFGIADPDVVPGGVGFRGSWRDCYRVNLLSRVASRVLWQVGHTRYRHEDDIYQAAAALHWPDWFAVRSLIRVNVSAIGSPLRSLEFITLRIKDAVCDRFRAACGERPSVDTARPDVRIHAFLTDRDATFYLDTSGDALFKRGARREVGEAPLRENLAAGILRLAGWRPDEPLFDPMCGGGTFLAEAAQIALGIAPGIGRRFGFERLAVFDAALWKQVRAEALTPPDDRPAPELHGSDVDPTALAAARANLEAAGVLDFVHLRQADFTTVEAPCRPGVLVANPPYGVRMGDVSGLRALYPRLGDALKQRFAGWRAYLFSADMELPKLIGLKASRRTPLFNGSLECRLFEYRMVAGTMRRRTDADASPGPGVETGTDR